MITIINRRLDKLRLLRTYATATSKQEWKDSWATAKQFVNSGELKQKTYKYRTVFWKPYQGIDESTALRIVFGSSKLGSTIAIDIVPRKLTTDEWIDARAILLITFGEDTIWNDFRIQLMELTMDVRRPMADFIFVAPGLSTSDNKYADEGTQYLGAEYGQRSFCIYDKQKHLKNIKNKDIPYPLTRIECRRRVMKVTLSKLLHVPSPFDSLLAVPKIKLDKISELYPHDHVFSKFRASVLNGQTGHNAYREHNVESRKHIAKLLKPYALKLYGSPKHWTQWITKQLAFLAQNLNNL